MRGPWSMRRYRQQPLTAGGRAWLLAVFLHALLLGLPLALVSSPAKPEARPVLRIEPPPPPRLAGTAAPEPRPLPGVGEPKAPARQVQMVQPAPPPPPQPPLTEPKPSEPPEAEPPAPEPPREPPLPQVKPPVPPPRPVEPELPSPRMVRRTERTQEKPPEPPRREPQPKPETKPRRETERPPQPKPDPYDYIEKFYKPMNAREPLPEPAPPSAAESLDELFNRGGGTPGAARILPLGGSDSYSFRARREAFASVGLSLREFISDRRLYNQGSNMIQGVRTARGVRGLEPSVAPGRVIQIGLVEQTREALAEVDRRMTRMEEDYLRKSGLFGKVEVQQVEYKVILGEKGYELAVGNIAHRNKEGRGS